MLAASSRICPRGWCSAGNRAAGPLARIARRSGQSLSAVLMELRNLSAGLKARSEEQSRNHVDTVKGLVETPSCRSQYGFAVAAFHAGRPGPDSSPEMGRPGVRQRTSMDVTVATELDSDDLPDEYKTCIYRVVQEALHIVRVIHTRLPCASVWNNAPRHLILIISGRWTGFDVRLIRAGLLGFRSGWPGWEAHATFTQSGRGAILTVDCRSPKTAGA